MIMKNKNLFLLVCMLFISIIINTLAAQTIKKLMDEQYRPQIHFSPKAHWINDPNGMVYNKGIYHLFFQYHPYSSLWGPMHWGHATSKDMIHWNEGPIAIYPDSIGTIFSGSAVVDEHNTSGFGLNGKAPLVAIFTQHNMEGEKAGTNTFQNQSLAYSNDEGKTWIKYAGNPVIKNPGIKDFRDPKVMWYAPEKKWIMTLATADKVTFYSAPDLKNWTKESEFGKAAGAHGGVWECPDLISLDDNGKARWVLIVNINPGAPNLGSGTQYFVGEFNGKTFTTTQTDTKWLDYGPDNYAGVTWSNTGKRKILLGWMSNWMYANQVPTEGWRNAMTIPRELKLRNVGTTTYVTSTPVTELSTIVNNQVTVNNVQVNRSLNIADKEGKITLPCRINIAMDTIKNFSFVVCNNLGDTLLIGFNKERNEYYIDRKKSGKIDFSKDFAAKHVAPRFSKNNKITLTLIFDVSSVELFADDGLTVMTSIYFPAKPYTQIHLNCTNKLNVSTLQYCRLNNIW